MAIQTEARQSGYGYATEHNSPEQARGARRIYDRGMEIVQERSGSAMLIALGSGLVVGYLIGCSLANATWTERRTAEGLGQRVLDRLDRILPDAITSHFKG